jgi:DNA-binding ferritin-like protein
MDEETFNVLWHTPTEYNPLRHCPPYLPGLPYTPVVLSSEQRGAVKAFAKSAGAVVQGSSAVALLGGLQGAAMLHQTHHWSTRGRTFYADHQLFERLYNESLEYIDQVAERIIGLGTPRIQAFTQARLALDFVMKCGISQTPDEMIQASVKAEIAVLGLVDQVIRAFEVSGTMTPGTSNLLEGVADKHESFLYLLQQRNTPEGVPAAPVPVYTYDRG